MILPPPANEAPYEIPIAVAGTFAAVPLGRLPPVDSAPDGSVVHRVERLSATGSVDSHPQPAAAARDAIGLQKPRVTDASTAICVGPNGLRQNGRGIEPGLAKRSEIDTRRPTAPHR